MGSNRTFMELKLNILQVQSMSFKSSNRTFMELKLSATASSYLSI